MSILYMIMAAANNQFSTDTPGNQGVVLSLPASLDVANSGTPAAFGELVVEGTGFIDGYGIAGHQWMTPYHPTLVSQYETMLTYVSGAAPNTGVALNTWFQLNNTIAWGWTLNAPQTSKSFTGTLEIRRIAFPTDSVTAPVTVTLTQGA